MRLIISFLLLFISENAISQMIGNTPVDTSNYYSFYSLFGQGLSGKKITTSWLTAEEVTPVIMDEMAKAGYGLLSDFCLFKIDSAKYVVLNAYSRKSNFGFLYATGHYIMVDKKDRKASFTKRSYVSCEETPSGKANFIQINQLPDNIFRLDENCYWYQYSDNPDDNNKLVTKEIAIAILRMDVKACLARAPKAKKEN